ncbi:MAG: hypothetical protein ABTQ27_15245 [Amaricoccus sp.]|uniref:hypothetical protein n=1 Tax=Amaricoccus sp. TaxID=1872485 RepID=UPI00331640FD
MKLTEIFTPNEQPTVTYVRREQRGLEDQLRSAIETPKMVVSLSGPSKTGKTVLLKSILMEDDLIYLRGAYIKSVDDFWSSILSWFETPSSEVTATSTSIGGAISATAGGEVGIPFVAKGKTEVEGTGTYASVTGVQKTRYIDPAKQVVKEISGSSFTVLLDDYHYMTETLQSEIAKIIKSLAESGVRICTALVPHRAEDVLKANTELKGRLISIDIPEWEEAELRLIGERGFSELNVEIEIATLKRLTAEAMGSPQLMQVLCFNLCQQIGVIETVSGEKRPLVVPENKIVATLEASANFASSADLVQALHSGPKVKGTPRTQYDLNDGSRGDVYRAILLAITGDPVERDFTYDEIYQRVKKVCVGEGPTGQSISQSLNHMCSIAAANSKGYIIMEWDDDNLHIADPYLAFYMRASSKIEKLGKRRQSSSLELAPGSEDDHR